MTINLSETDLRRIFPHAIEAVMSSVAAEWNDTLGAYGLNATKNRLAFFMAETSAETGGWRGMVEGGEFSGDRDLYKGRGLIQLTGKSNYQAIGEKLAQDFPNSGLVFDIANNPQLVSVPKYVLKTAVAYWDLNKLNAICDTGDFLHLSNRINGSKTVPNGWSLRQSELARIERLLTQIGGTSAEPASSPTILQLGDSGQLVSALQTMLRSAGYDVGGVDGKFGTLTRMALMAFQADHDLVPTGVADAGTNIALNNPGQRPLDDQRVSATISDLIKNGSRTAVNGRRVNWMGALATILGSLGIVNSGIVGAANSGTANAARSMASTPSSTDTIGPTVQHLQNILSSAPLNATNLAPLKSQLQEIAYSLDTFRQANLAPLKVTDIPGTLQKIHDLLLTQPVSTAAGKNAQELVNQLIAFQNQLVALQPMTDPAIHPTVSNINSVFDMLPPDALGAVTPVLTTVANSVLPGFGGALVTLGLGVATQVFGNRVLNARLDDHRSAANTKSNRLRG
ncbi:MAG: peptidoglycan-binding protein [Hyphomicrobiales bacterium]|nr:peptidoglycan-binding protein [Hyphomicrobiales bacterium]MBV9907069.1 peptidoglycan-binding protein [Hyphomicrobiales bacterium]